MMRKELLYRIIRQYSESNPINGCNMVSNGYFINMDSAKNLKYAGINSVQISLDGATPQSHNWLRNNEHAFEHAINAIKCLRNLDIPVSVACTPTKMNIAEVDDLINLCLNYGIMMFRMQPIMSLGRGKGLKDVYLTNLEYLKLSRRLLSKSADLQKSGMRIEWGDPISHLLEISAGTSRMNFIHINAYGDIQLSPYLPINFGNVKKHSLDDYFNNGLEDIVYNKFVRWMAGLISSTNQMSLSNLEPQITYSLNITGQKVWNMIENNGYSIAEISKVLSNSYSQDYQIVLEDVLKILERLWINGFIKWRKGENPFSYKYTSNIGQNLLCEQIWIDRLNDVFKSIVDLDSIFYIDPFLSENEFSDNLKNARNVFYKNVCLFVLKNKTGEIVADIIMQLDRVNMISYILRFSFKQNEISYENFRDFIVVVINNMESIYNFRNYEKGHLTILLNAIDRSKNLNFLNDLGFSCVGLLPKESKNGDIRVFKFDVSSVQHK